LAQENHELRQEISWLRDEIVRNRGGYVSSDMAPHFHRRDCEWAKALNSTFLVEYDSRDHAMQRGKTPCGICRP
jgi:hypothetical protein